MWLETRGKHHRIDRRKQPDHVRCDFTCRNSGPLHERKHAKYEPACVMRKVGQRHPAGKRLGQSAAQKTFHQVIESVMMHRVRPNIRRSGYPPPWREFLKESHIQIILSLLTIQIQSSPSIFGIKRYRLPAIAAICLVSSFWPDYRRVGAACHSAGDEFSGLQGV